MPSPRVRSPTIEGLGSGRLHPLQELGLPKRFRSAVIASQGKSWRRRHSSPGANPTDAMISEQMTNLCRCGTYPQFVEAFIGRQALRDAFVNHFSRRHFE